MPAHQITLEIPELRWRTLADGSYWFAAGNQDCGFEATMNPSGPLVAEFRYDGDGGRGDYWIESGDHLRGVLGELLLYVAGLRVKANLIALANAAVRDGQLPLPMVGEATDAR